MDIAEDLQKLAEDVAIIYDEIDDIRLAINAQGVNVPAGTPLTAFPAAVAAIETGGGGSSSVSNGVKATFIDFDGTILKEEYGPLGFTPTPPADPTGDDIRVFSQWIGNKVAITEDTVIGATYWFQSDLDSYLFLDLNEGTGLTIGFRCYINSGSATIYWGDGTSDTTSGTGNILLTKVYLSFGLYRIKVHNLHLDERNTLGGTASTTYKVIDITLALYKAYIGYPTILCTNSFYNCVQLQSVCFSGVGTTMTQYMDFQGFYGCNALQAMVVPGCYFCGTLQSAAYSCRGLKYFIFPEGVLSGYMSIPSTFLGVSTSLEYAILPVMPYFGSSVFRDSSLKHFTFREGVMHVSSSVFYNNYALRTVKLSSTITYIYGTAFYNCWSLSEIDIPASVATIETNVFDYCWSLKIMTVRNATPPNLNATNGFAVRSRLPSGFKIYVPADSVDTYKAATGWNLYSDIIFAID